MHRLFESHDRRLACNCVRDVKNRRRYLACKQQDFMFMNVFFFLRLSVYRHKCYIIDTSSKTSIVTRERTFRASSLADIFLFRDQGSSAKVHDFHRVSPFRVRFQAYVFLGRLLDREFRE